MAEENKSTSPLPQAKTATKQYNFYEALKRLADGKKIASLAWPADEYGLLKDSLVMLYKGNKFYSCTISDGDLEATDWVIM